MGLPNESVGELAGRWGADSRMFSFVREAANRVYRCESADGPFYLRLTLSTSRTLELVSGALDWQRHLHGAGAPVAEPLISTAGRWIETATSGPVTFFATATRAAPGRPVNFDTLSEIAAWAEAVGMVHAASERYEPAPVRTTVGMIPGKLPTLPELWRATAPVIAGDESLVSHYARGSDWLRQLGEPVLVTHGDVRPENASIDGGRVVLLYFDEPTWAWPPYDLARMMLDDAAAPPKDPSRHRSALLDGYRRARPAISISTQALDRFLAIRALLMYGWSLEDSAGANATWLERLRSAFTPG